MRAHWPALHLLLPALAAALVLAAPSSSDDSSFARSLDESLSRRDGHGHGHSHNSHAAPIITLNETEVLMYHAPTPDSYWSLDIDRVHPEEKRYPALMGTHIVFMSAAFFGALPVGIALRSVKHAWHGLFVILFWTFVSLGLAANGLYKKLTPDMYEGQKHSVQGYFVLFIAAVLSAFDLIAIFGRFVSYVRGVRAGQDQFSFVGCWRAVVLDRAEDRPLGTGAEYTGLVSADPEELDAAELKTREIEGDEPSSSIQDRRARFVPPINTEFSPRISAEHEHEEWANDNGHHSQRYPQSAASERTVFEHSRSGSTHSDDTLHESVHRSSWSELGRAALLKKIGRAVFATAERILVFAGLFQVTTGIVIYTGGCRENYINGCLAHLIKGGIFWCYGLASFARFLGSFSELGWAWNRAPSKSYPSAEFVECFVIFLYGITNTWMERFGAKPGDPFTTKQVQHISIAVMFWFAGLIGMGIESKRVRRWLASSAAAALPSATRSQEAVAEPPSYIASFNPFPALCIGITGAAMAAHFQTYLFQVQIHELWGNLLSAFAVLRCVTYFFLWLSPPRSILPSRPPTEALASFFLACGGLVFQFSTEEVTIAAMRRGHDDMMMFLNVAVATTCLAFCWTLGIVAFKGWLKSHATKSVKFHSSA
ncbi:hypothetical protein BDY19DRAFT_566400 [Irpex rosettiformis]|uniref:Uncharacterized protein n=1 Tax=Irpex rosettiformis TaxID=378272 RepID=A0ACB8UC50_9APHY|nr:hypothetical protein BDY19DRAFT_566400 [Irpex rosettiformis]